MVESLANRFVFRSESLKVFPIGGINGNTYFLGSGRNSENTPYSAKSFSLLVSPLKVLVLRVRVSNMARARISERSDVRPLAPQALGLGLLGLVHISGVKLTFYFIFIPFSFFNRCIVNVLRFLHSVSLHILMTEIFVKSLPYTVLHCICLRSFEGLLGLSKPFQGLQATR